MTGRFFGSKAFSESKVSSLFIANITVYFWKVTMDLNDINNSLGAKLITISY